MTKIIRFCQLFAGLIVAAFFAAQPVVADTIELNNSWASSGTVHINFTGINWHDGSSVTQNVIGGSGGFKYYDLTSDPEKKNTFQSFCAGIFRSFNFAVDPSDVLKSADVALTGSAATTPTVQSMIRGRGNAQDVVVFAPVPEPQTYAMLLAGLGIIGFTLRHRKQI